MRHRALAAIVIALVPLVAVAETSDRVATRETIQSEILGEERVIFVRVPDGYARSSARYPVLYLSDGDVQLVHTVGTVSFLERNGRIPPLIVVGIANTDRTRDLTPTRAALTRPDGTPVDFPTSGGNANFLSFLEKELIPSIDARYRTTPLRIYAGHSFGGLSAVNALATRPDLFRGLISASPGLNWDEGVVIRRVEKLLRERKSLPALLYVSIGAEGEDAVRAVRRLEAVTDKHAPDGFDARFGYFDDEDHGSTVLLTHYHALRAIFEGWNPPRDAAGNFAGGWKGVRAHYAALSKRFGYEIPVPEAVGNQAGYQLLAAGDLEEAIEVFRANAEAYPQSANVYDSLGEAFEKSGRIERALEQYEKAVARSEGDPNAAIYRANRDRARAALD